MDFALDFSLVYSYCSVTMYSIFVQKKAVGIVNERLKIHFSKSYFVCQQKTLNLDYMSQLHEHATPDKKTC